MKQQVVIFTEDNAIIKIVDDVSYYKGMPNVVINPELRNVAGIPPHQWKLVLGKIVKKTEDEINSSVIKDQNFISIEVNVLKIRLKNKNRIKIILSIALALQSIAICGLIYKEQKEQKVIISEKVKDYATYKTKD